MLVNYLGEGDDHKENHQLIKFLELMLKQTYHNHKRALNHLTLGIKGSVGKEIMVLANLC